jgi:hypothetical protein
MKTTTTTDQWASFEAGLSVLFRSLIPDIRDEYRASDDLDDETPGMLVTIGATVQPDGEIVWNYQTGDNSFTGGAYGHPVWGVVSLFRDSEPSELARECADQISDNLPA